MLSHIWFATGNSEKFKEVALYFKEALPDVEIRQLDVDLEEIQSVDQAAIAVHKARQAWAMVKEPVMVDDSGVYFHRYRDFPGVMTKQVFQSLGVEGLFRLVTPGERASFKLSLVLWYAENEYQLFSGECAGVVGMDMRYTSSSDYPYNPYFFPDGAQGRSYAELHANGQKNEFSYRLQAAKKMITWLVHAYNKNGATASNLDHFSV
jgi:XTP/dITP diphosphohydrolase